MIERTSQGNIVYTPELVSYLKEKCTARPRPDAQNFLRKELKISPRRAREIYHDLILAKQKRRNDEKELPIRKQASADYHNDVGVAESVMPNIHTLEELLEACQVDLDVWEVERYIVNKWETARKNKTANIRWTGGKADGYVDDKGGMSSHPLVQVKAWLVRKVPIKIEKGAEELLESFRNRAEEHSPKEFFYSLPTKNRDCLYLLNTQDLHMAKLANRRESGDSDYDIRLAEKAFVTAVDDLMRKVPRHRVEEVVMIAGSDMLQIDNDKSSTTAGTYVDSDTRLSKAFEVCADMLTRVIEKIASDIRVRVIVIPGNHDMMVSLFLGNYLAAWFRNHKNVIVDKEPKSRKYVPYGKNLIGFDHGDKTKLADLPLTMMRENQSSVSQYKWFEILTGHLHHDAVQEIKGVKVRVAPALCPPDKWHAEKALIGNIRTSQGLLYNREDGLEAIYYSKPLEA